MICHHCNKATNQDNSLDLWDGRRYCRSCVEDASPLLLAYAQSHNVLREEAPFDRRAVRRNALRVSLIVGTVLVAIIAAAGLPGRELANTLRALAILGLIMATVTALQLPAFLWHTRRMLPTVAVAGGAIRLGRNGGLYGGSLPLSDVTWKIGTSRQDSQLRNTLVQKQAVVLVLIPRRLGRFTFGNERFACGWSEETRIIWTAFLTLAQVPRASVRQAR